MIVSKESFLGEFWIKGDIPSHPRPRFNRHSGRVYLPQKYMDWKKDSVIQLQPQWKKEPIDGCIAISLSIVHTRPQSRFRKSNQDYRIPKITGGDLDNEIKSVLDVLVDAQILTDDRIIWEIRAQRFWSAKDDPAHCWIQISEKTSQWKQ